MLGTVVVSFFVCLLPFRLLTLISVEDSEHLSAEFYYLLVNFCRSVSFFSFLSIDTFKRFLLFQGHGVSQLGRQSDPLQFDVVQVPKRIPPPLRPQELRPPGHFHQLVDGHNDGRNQLVVGGRGSGQQRPLIGQQFAPQAAHVPTVQPNPPAAGSGSVVVHRLGNQTRRHLNFLLLFR